MFLKIAYQFGRSFKSVDEMLVQHQSKRFFKQQLEIAKNNEKAIGESLRRKLIKIPLDQLEVNFVGEELKPKQAEIRFNINDAQWFINEESKERFRTQFQSYFINDNECVIKRDKGKNQEENLIDAIEKLKNMVYKVSIPPKGSFQNIPKEFQNLDQERINSKRKKSEIKKLRQAQEVQ